MQMRYIYVIHIFFCTITSHPEISNNITSLNDLSFFNILSTVVLKGSAFFTGMLFARLLGGSGYGSLKLYNISVSIVAVVFSLQTQTTLANARVEYPEEAQKGYQSSVMTLSVLFFGLCTGLTLMFLKPLSIQLELEPLIILLVLLQFLF